MSDLTQVTPQQYYGDLLTTTNGGQGLSDTLAPLQDGLGNDSPIEISQDAVNFSRTDGKEFQLDGVALTASATDLNDITSGSFPTGNYTVNGDLTITGAANFNAAINYKLTQLNLNQSNYSVTSNDCIIALNEAFSLDGTFEIILPAAVDEPSERIITIKDQTGSLTATKTIQIFAPLSETIDGQQSIELTSPYACVTLYAGPLSWFTLSRNS